VSERVLFGPFIPGIVDVERIAELRSLAALCAVFCGSSHPLVAALRQAEADDAAAAQALELLNHIPSLTRRRLLSTFGAITWPAKPRSSTRFDKVK
jgi:hypothetical protein